MPYVKKPNGDKSPYRFCNNKVWGDKNRIIPLNWRQKYKKI